MNYSAGMNVDVIPLQIIYLVCVLASYAAFSKQQFF